MKTKIKRIVVNLPQNGKLLPENKVNKTQKFSREDILFAIAFLKMYGEEQCPEEFGGVSNAEIITVSSGNGITLSKLEEFGSEGLITINVPGGRYELSKIVGQLERPLSKAVARKLKIFSKPELKRIIRRLETIYTKSRKKTCKFGDTVKIYDSCFPRNDIEKTVKAIVSLIEAEQKCHLATRVSV